MHSTTLQFIFKKPKKYHKCPALLNRDLNGRRECVREHLPSWAFGNCGSSNVVPKKDQFNPFRPKRYIGTSK